MPIFRVTVMAMAAIFAAIAIVIGIYGYFNATRGQPAFPNFGGPFALASSRGGTVASKDLQGKPFAIFFGFTNCPEVCPTTMFEMTKAMQQLGSEAKDFRMFFVTVDPERDTVEKMRDYVANFDPRIEALVPTEQQLKDIAKSYRVFYEKVPTSDGSYTMNHTATVYLMNGQGALASTISYDDKEDVRIAKLRKLLSAG